MMLLWMTLFLQSSGAKTFLWSDIEIKQTIVLNRSIPMVENTTIPKGLVFEVKDIIGLEQIRVVYFRFKANQCPRRIAGINQGEIAILDEKYGYKLNLKCDLEMWVESKDLADMSVFSSKQKNFLPTASK